ncbi:hypothetical protein PIB30_007216 [Stylosanthes scabra]|uniref:DUF4283 domain-containing protein n=1 Tax=Stylosanthes scabra TaxID=79078 RepID=A0ABU6V3J1_9FABA|nr:hypothetical protein [Stylosanthes scabra]
MLQAPPVTVPRGRVRGSGGDLQIWGWDLVAEVFRKEDPGDLVRSKSKETKRMILKLQDLDKGHHENPIVNLNTLENLGNSKLELQRDDIMTEKMERSLIGETMNPIDFDNLKMKIYEGWKTITEIRRMGGYKLVMTFDSKENMEKALESPTLLTYFMELRRWGRFEVCRTRRFWIEVFGMPAHAWNEDNRRRVGEVWGRVLYMKEPEEDQLDSFQIMAESNYGPYIQSWLDVTVDGDEFRLFVKEMGIQCTEQEGCNRTKDNPKRLNEKDDDDSVSNEKNDDRTTTEGDMDSP